MSRGFFSLNKKGQIAIFVIIALVIVGGIIAYFALRERVSISGISPEFQPIYTYYQACIADEAKAAIDLAESQAGHVYPGTYIPGSEYAPSSSQLNFLGFAVPYWYYISGNGLIKENVPTKSQIEQEISTYIAEGINTRCNLDSFYAQGFTINLSTPEIKTTIADTTVSIDVNENIYASKGGSSATKTAHHADVNSVFGKLYNTALSIYQKEKAEAFLENYSVDVLRLYTPVDGVELTCGGKIWKTREVADELKSGLEANIGAIKFKGSYYKLQNKEENYFVVDLPVDNAVNLIYSRAWPTKMEIYGADDELMVAEPVGVKEGAGMLGFCYAPYHFVYDITYPVLLQVYDGSEIFQFPVVVVIDKNMPRKGIYSEIGYDISGEDVCQFNTQDITVNVYNINLNRIDANLSYNCFDQTCRLGESAGGVFEGKAPACVNGYLTASSGGYADKKEIISTNEQSSVEMILDREYNVGVRLEVGGRLLNEGTALVMFNKGQQPTSAMLPDSPNAKLSEGSYNVSIYVYSNSSIVIPASTRKECTTVSKGGLAAFFGGTEEKCFNIDIPETNIEQGLIGGGKSEITLLPVDLEKGNLTLRVDSLPAPDSIEQLQANYALFNEMHVEVAYET